MDKTEQLEKDVESPDEDQDQLTRSDSEDSDKDISKEDGKKEEPGKNGIDYKQRYSDTKSDRDRLKAEADSLRAENDNLKLEKEKRGAIDDVDLERQFFDEMYDDVSKIDPSDADKSKKIYSAIAKGMAKAVKVTKEQTLREMSVRARENSIVKTKQSSQISQAENMAKIALEEIGLDPEKHYNEFTKEVDGIMAKKPNWFKVVPGEQQFMKIAQFVKDRLDKVKTENDEHRKEAGGLIGLGNKVTKKKSSAEEDDDSPDTMTGALAVLHKQRKADAARAYKFARD